MTTLNDIARTIWEDIYPNYLYGIVIIEWGRCRFEIPVTRHALENWLSKAEQLTGEDLDEDIKITGIRRRKNNSAQVQGEPPESIS